MNFLVDANLPRRLVILFRERGHQATHTLELPEGNSTEDSAILEYVEMHECIVTTKDSDFTTSFWVNDRPQKLLLISTGNISNKELEKLIATNFNQIINDLTSHRFIELTREHLIVHA